jgi:hypothetical protein
MFIQVEELEPRDTGQSFELDLPTYLPPAECLLEVVTTAIDVLARPHLVSVQRKQFAWGDCRQRLKIDKARSRSVARLLSSASPLNVRYDRSKNQLGCLDYGLDEIVSTELL